MKTRSRIRTFGRGMKTVASVLLATMPFLGLPDMALALPHGGIVSKGSATLGYSTNALLVHQTTNSATFNWSSYVVKSGQTVTYQTPGSSSVSLNMIGGTSPTQIMGSVKSNGVLEFMNSNGIVFGQGSSVSAAGVMAFGSTNPWGTPTGAVSNAGTITASTGGTVALVGTNVTNTGTITAPGGTIVLAAGSTVVPVYSGGSSSLSAVTTTGSGGVLDTGVISAETVGAQTGKIVLQGGMTSGYVSLQPSAVIDASAPNGGNGGTVVINGSEVVLDNTTPVNVSSAYGEKGTVTIDPNLILSGTTLDVCNATGLETIDTNQTSLTVATNTTDPLSDTIVLEGNMNLGGSYSWTPLGNNTNNFTGTFNGNGYVVSGYTITATANNTGFIGYLGSGATVENLGVSGTVNGGSYNCIGGVVGWNNGTVKYSYNTGNVSGNNSVGGVVGDANSGTVEYSYNTGRVSGAGDIGGVVGKNCGGIAVEYSYNTGSVSGSVAVGGVAGLNHYATVKYSYNTGAISGTSDVGGIVGLDYMNSYVSYAYNLGNVSGSGSNIGGAVGTYQTCAPVNVFYNTGVGYGSGGAGTGLSSTSFGTSTNFTNWTTANNSGFNGWSFGGFSTSTIGSPWYIVSSVTYSTNNSGGTATMAAPVLAPTMATANISGQGSSTYNGASVTNGYRVSYTLGATTLPGAITVTPPAAFGPNAGAYTASPTVTGTCNIAAPTSQTSVSTVTFASGTWTINPLSVTATANAASMTAGSSVPSLSGAFTTTGPTSGLANLAASWVTPATSASVAGSYAINPGTYSYSGGANSGDFTITNASGNATALTISASSGGTSGGSSSGGSTPAPLSSSPSSPVAPLSTLSSVVPELQTVEPLMTGVVSTGAPMAPVSEPSVTNVASGGMVTIASGGAWSLGILPGVPFVTIDPTAVVAANPVTPVSHRIHSYTGATHKSPKSQNRGILLPLSSEGLQ